MVKKRRIGKCRRNARKAQALKNARDEDRIEVEKVKAEIREQGTQKELIRVPHSFIIHSGSVGRYIRELERDLRRVMEPNTASNLQVLKRNNLKDFIVNGAVLGVTHVMVLTRSENSVHFRIIRSPQGPTVYFKVKEYTLARDVRSHQKRSYIMPEMFQSAPLVVMNGFNNPEKKHLQLVQTMVQNMFPVMNVDTLKLSKVKRCVLWNYNEEDDTIEFRHYSIKSVPAGVNKTTKKLLQSKIPNLANYKDISDYFLNPGQLSESEFEGEQKEVELTQDLASRGCKAGLKTNLRLIELGPRMKMQLYKVYEGVDEGEMLYHAYVKKSSEEIAALRARLPALKKRRLRHEKNVEHRVIRRLKAVDDRKKEDEEAERSQTERLARKQAQVTGHNVEDPEEEARKYEEKRKARQEKREKEGKGKKALKKKKKAGGKGKRPVGAKKAGGASAAGIAKRKKGAKREPLAMSLKSKSKFKRK
ncbi:hypothetical protein QR680_010820 [Steinernema hermaphroditum]|uniref:Brix domain-containing protein n=1 Tax=Steinernema hermaphroditum TaxID=289476 RepID=A0AA39IRP5_9BILA|nr:hypothetical protein QR680_010820 [Steinernema hermaphroditum]